MKRPAFLLLAAAGLASLAQAADLPTKKEVVPAPKPNCWGSFWTWLNSSADDCPIGAYGITLYGTVDVGLGYQSWGATFNPSADKNNYGIQKSGHQSLWLPTYNGLSSSVLGLKMKEDLAPLGLTGWSLVGVLEAGINPYSGMFLNPPRSLADQNTSPANKFPWQTSNFDSSRNGSWMNSQGYFGVSNKVWGTLTFGRTNSLSFDTQNKYDPLNSTAFSLIGFSSSFPGFGDTELVRPNTAFTYKVAVPNVGPLSVVRLAGQAQVGGYNWQNASQGAYSGQIGFDWNNFSFDGVVEWAKDAVSLSTFGGANNATSGCAIGDLKVSGFCYDPNSVLKATLSNNFGAELMASYKWDRFKFYAGYIYARQSNPSDPYTYGFRTIYPEVFVPYGAVTSNNYNFDKELNSFWTGVKWSVPDTWLHGYGSLDLAAGFYYQTQNNFNFTVTKLGYTLAAACTGSGAFISSSKCAGSQDAISFLADWKPFKRVDIYAGVMYSNVYGGLANGFTQTYTYFAPTPKGKIFTATATTAHTSQWDPTIGIRIRF